jgi:DNA-binding response OmpR family regulator
MNASSRPPPTVLFVHDGAPYHAHIRHLQSAGLMVTQVHADAALSTAKESRPDIVVLDFGCDGDVTKAFKDDHDTSHIPVIALVELLKS